MGDVFTIPSVLTHDDKVAIEEDLSLALILWSLELERERGGGLLRKKNPELVTHVSFLYRPIVFTTYRNAVAAFDSCGLESTHFRYGVAPSLTHPLSHLISSSWISKPESYAKGLDEHSSEFEKARDEHQSEIQGWITNPNLLGELGELLKTARPSDSRPEILPPIVGLEKAKESLASLDRLKNLLFNEIVPLKGLQQKLYEKTSEVLAPLDRECVAIEEKYNREIDRIRPSVLQRKEQYENERMKHHHQIVRRFSGRLHELEDRRDSAAARIRAFNSYSSRKPRGGIDRQYSIKENAERRIKDLESDRDEQLALVDAKYDALIQEEQARIDVIEHEKQTSLTEPKRKIQVLNQASQRLVRAIGGLIDEHNSVIGLGFDSGVVRPINIGTNDFVVYLPTIVCVFDNGIEQRLKILTTSTLKGGKGVVGSLKGWVGIKYVPLETPEESHLFEFVAAKGGDSEIAKAMANAAGRYNILANPETKRLCTSGTAKMQARGWIKEKEAKEFLEAFNGCFKAKHEHSNGAEVASPVHGIRPAQRNPSLVRFVDYKGQERLVSIDELESIRREDERQFSLGAQALIEEQKKKEEQNSLLNYVVQTIEAFRPSKRYHNEFPYQTELQGWLRARFPTSRIEIQTGASRPDIVIEDVAIEVKGPTDNRALETLTTKCLKYSHYYDKVILVLFEPVFSESNFREIQSGIERHFPHVRILRKDVFYSEKSLGTTSGEAQNSRLL